MSADDNTPEHFWPHLCAALQQAGCTDLPTLDWHSSSPALRQLVNHLIETDRALRLVLDDVQQVTDVAIYRDLAEFIEQTPAHFRLVLLSRRTPPLPLARWRVRGLLAELDEADLAFTATETAVLLAPLPLGDDANDVLAQRTEGWAAALELARLAWREAPAAPVETIISGAHRRLADFFSAEVMAEAADLLDFLLPIALLDRWSAPLCDAVLGRTDSRAVIARLEREHIFVVPLDAERRWYRFHRLFGEYLSHRLQQETPARAITLYRATATWYAAHGDGATAIHYWLLAGDETSAADTIESLAEAMIDRGAAGVLLGWLEQISDAVLQERPHLNLLYTWALLSTARWDLAEARLRRVEQQVAQAGMGETPTWAPAPELLGQLAATRATIAMTWNDAPAILANVQEARQLLAPRDSFWQCTVAINLGLMKLFEDDLTGALQAFADAVHTAELLDNPFFAAIALGEMGSVHLRRAQLGQATSIYRRIERMDAQLAQALPVHSPIAPAADFGLGRVAFARNQLDAAHGHLTRAIELSHAANNVEYLALCQLQLAEVLRAQGDTPAAYAALHLAEQTVRRYNPQHAGNKLGHISMTLARFWLVDGNLEAAQRWAADNRLTLDDNLDYARALDHLTLAHIRLLEAQRTDDGAIQAPLSHFLDRLLATAQRAGRSEDMIEILCLHSLLAYHQRRELEAANRLDEAMALAEPEGYMRRFLDFGDALLPVVLLCLQAYGRQLAPLQRPTKLFVRTVLTNFGLARALTVADLLPPPLTPRELELLRVIAATPDLSNRELARRLTLSVGTIKTHIKSIYAKLDAHSRAEAVLNARRQKLV